jgi:hypothetical protein
MQALKSNLTDWRPLHHMVLLDKQVASTPALLGRSAMNHTKNRQRTGRHKKKTNQKRSKQKEWLLNFAQTQFNLVPTYSSKVIA